MTYLKVPCAPSSQEQAAEDLPVASLEDQPL
jgi:hypothetical protein